MANVVLMQGNEACVEGGLHAGMRFYGGYPITPSTEIAEVASIRLPQVGGRFIQMEDEIAGIASAIGGSVAGAKSMTATSGPGFSLKQENLGYAALAEIPLVVVDVQRSGPSTGLPTSPSQGDMMQAKWGTHGDHPVIALVPSSVKETYELTVRAFNLSEKYRTPVLLMLDEIIGHLREGIDLDELKNLPIIDRKIPADPKNAGLPYALAEGELVPSMAPFGMGQHYNITGLLHDDAGFPTNSNELSYKLVKRIMDKIDNNIDDIVEVDEYLCDDAETLVFCYGGTARSAATAVDVARKAGMKVGMFRPRTIWPFPEKQLKALSSGKVKHILVAEHNYGQMLFEVERVVKNDCTLDFVGKIDGTILTPSDILKKLGVQ